MRIQSTLREVKRIEEKDEPFPVVVLVRDVLELTVDNSRSLKEWKVNKFINTAYAEFRDLVFRTERTSATMMESDTGQLASIENRSNHRLVLQREIDELNSDKTYSEHTQHF
jgi:hypothetical protein